MYTFQNQSITLFWDALYEQLSCDTHWMLEQCPKASRFNIVW